MVNSNPVLDSKILLTFPFPIFLKSSFLTTIIMRFFSGVKPFNEESWNQILNSSTSMNTRICGPTKIFLTRVKSPISNMRGILRIFRAMSEITSSQRSVPASSEKWFASKMNFNLTKILIIRQPKIAFSIWIWIFSRPIWVISTIIKKLPVSKIC